MELQTVQNDINVMQGALNSDWDAKTKSYLQKSIEIAKKKLDDLTPKQASSEDLKKRLKLVKILVRKNPKLKLRIKVIERMIQKAEEQERGNMAQGGKVADHNQKEDIKYLSKEKHEQDYAKNTGRKRDYATKKSDGKVDDGKRYGVSKRGDLYYVVYKSNGKKVPNKMMPKGKNGYKSTTGAYAQAKILNNNK